MTSPSLSRSPTMPMWEDGFFEPVDDDEDDDDGSPVDRGAPPQIAKPDPIPLGLLDDERGCRHPKRLIIAVDFGTTYSAVSYAALDEGESGEAVTIERIHSIKNYPDDTNFNSTSDRMKNEVPTEILYPLTRAFRYSATTNLAEDDTGSDDSDAPPFGGLETQDEHQMDMDGDSSYDYDYDAPFDQTMFDHEDDSLKWGYGVHSAWRLPDTHFNKSNRALSRFKLLLDTSETTEKIRTELGPTLDTLKSRRFIKKGVVSIIADYLSCLLSHTKAELDGKGFDDSYQVEMVLCVPAIWSQKACRSMQYAMAIAVERAKFKGVDIQNNSIEKLFIVSEPEAAAAYALEMHLDSSVRSNDCFVLLDAGGGTVDANTYKVTQAEPLRLEREVVEPGGGLFGSSFLNQDFKKLFLERLKNETYLEHGRITIEGIVEKIMIDEFEYRFKRSFDIHAKGKMHDFFFVSTSLRDDRSRGFSNGRIYVPFATSKKIFLNCFTGICQVMEKQIEAARRNGTKVNKVILIGGFAGLKSLRVYLKARLDSICRQWGWSEDENKIELIAAHEHVTAVASGAVLRALNKEGGPGRQAKSSYGILRSEPFGLYPEHRVAGQKKSFDRDDGQEYVKSTIDWLLRSGSFVPSTWICEPFLCSHTFKCRPGPPPRLRCEEILWVSDEPKESHYHMNHIKNRGAEIAGRIIADFTFLRERGLISPIGPTYNEKGRLIGRRHYKVEYTMAIKVVDRDLRCYAVFKNQIVQRCRINIAPGFNPGVK